MTLYRKFGQGMAILCCVAMFVMAIVFVVSGGFSVVDEESNDVIYFYERSNFQGAVFVAASFLVSVIANMFAIDLPQVATGISLLPLVMTFYEMAVENLNFVVAAVILLLALIHVAGNAIAWWDLHKTKKVMQLKKAKEAEQSAEAEQPAAK